MKSVALVGFYDPTLPAVKNTTADEVWVPNHGYMVMENDLPRCDRLFEIHKKDWFLRKEYPAYREYWEWLKQPHTFPIYIQEDLPEVISGVVYPYKEVCEDLFPHLLRQNPSGELIRDTFLTSTISIMLALAIHEKFERVWIYGIGMTVDTEYFYQLPGFTYMIGLANGRGIDVVNQHNSPICKASVYAFETLPLMELDRIKELREHYYAKLIEQNDKTNAMITDLNAGKTKNIDEVYQASDLTNSWRGALAMIDQLIKQDSRWMSRQSLEVLRRPYIEQAETFKADVNSLNGQYFSLLKQSRNKEAEKLWPEYLDKRASMHAAKGAVQLLDNLIKESDLLKVDHEIVLAMKDV